MKKDSAETDTLPKITADFDSLDNNGDLHISREEADDNGIWEHFLLVDTNADTMISLQEYRTYLQLNPQSAEDSVELLRRSEMKRPEMTKDMAKNSYVTEGTEAENPRDWSGDIEKIDTDFDSLDNNDDKFVSREEADDNNIYNYFPQIDTNGDSLLSKKEYMNFVMSNPAAVEDYDEVEESE